MPLTLEKHLEEICPICKRKHSKEWKSCFDRHNHYKTLECEECGYEILIPTDWITSGIEK